MNATEINGSAWPIKYYVIVSVPLTVATLLVPLFAIQTFNFLVRIFQTSARVRRIAKWGWISAAFIFELLAVVLPITNTASLVAGPVSSSIVSFAAFTYTIKNSIAFKNMTQNKGLPHKGFRCAPISNHQLWFLFCFVTLALQLAKVGIHITITLLDPWAVRSIAIYFHHEALLSLMSHVPISISNYQQNIFCLGFLFPYVFGLTLT